MKIARATVTWRKNERGEGVIAWHDRIVVFPARPGFAPPEGSGAAPAHHLPEAGDEDEVVLVKPDEANNFFAYPPALQLEEKHGFFFVQIEEGEADVTVVPAWPCHRVMASEGPRGNIHITVIPHRDREE